MKKLVLLCFIAAIISSCKGEDPVNPNRELEIKLSYKFSNSGDMSRASNSDIYAEFYDQFIKPHILTPTKYSLSFKNIETNAVTTINGSWKDNTGIRLLSGKYEITGISHPTFAKAIGMPSDTVYIAFNEIVTIGDNMTELTLNATYDSYLLLFDKQHSSNVSYRGKSTNVSGESEIQLKSTDKLYWLFINGNEYTSISSSDNTYIFKNSKMEITRNNGDNATIYFEGMPFELGKYYYFNDVTNSFDIPTMEKGN